MAFIDSIPVSYCRAEYGQAAHVAAVTSLWSRALYAIAGHAVRVISCGVLPLRWFVSRHPGAVEWLAEHGVQVDRQVAHLDVEQIQPGDWVLGTLPVSLAAIVCARGAVYVHLHVAVPAALRGQELTSGQLREIGARLSVYRVIECEASLPLELAAQ